MLPRPAGDVTIGPMQGTRKPERAGQSHTITRLQLAVVASILCVLAGSWWIRNAANLARQTPEISEPSPTGRLESGQIASMNSPVFQYSPGWTVDATGADPAEPEDPWQEPAGVLTFDFNGQELALKLAVGDYWGYLYVTVDGQPVTLMPVIPGNHNARGEMAGYRTFYAPEMARADGPGEVWVRVDQSDSTNRSHRARIEIWRAWDQIPIRAVAVDALPAKTPPLWPGTALLVASALFAAAAWYSRDTSSREAGPTGFAPAFNHIANTGWLSIAAGAGLLLAIVGTLLSNWLVCSAGLGLLALASIARPVYWIAALLFALPYYFTLTLPLLPNRSFGLIDIGTLGALVLVGIHRFGWVPRVKNGVGTIRSNHFDPILTLIAAIAAWALISASEAVYASVALYEWRTIFLAALLFGIALRYVLQLSASHSESDRMLLLFAWLAGATSVSLIALWQYASDSMLITAEGVRRARALYGSPNNLALYLERSLIVTIALALLTVGGRWRLLWGTMVLIQGAALLFTFSKGSLLLGVPAGLLTLWIGTFWWLRREKASLRPLWWLAAIGVLGLIGLTPFLATDRFKQLFDLSSGTGYLRLLLWRSSWQMGLEQPIFGVGPDNFLYAYRSWYILPQAWQEPNLNHPHNWILDWWTRLGAPGLLIGTAFFCVGLFVLWRGFRDSSLKAVGALEPVLYLGLLAASVTGLVHGLIDASYALPDLMLVWTWIFLLGSTSVLRQSRNIAD